MIRTILSSWLLRSKWIKSHLPKYYLVKKKKSNGIEITFYRLHLLHVHISLMWMVAVGWEMWLTIWSRNIVWIVLFYLEFLSTLRIETLKEAFCNLECWFFWCNQLNWLITLFDAEKCPMVISAPIWGLGSEGPSARLLPWFLQDKGNEEAKQERCVKSKSWKWRRAYCLKHC